MTKVWKSDFLWCVLEYIPVVYTLNWGWVFSFSVLVLFWKEFSNFIFWRTNFLVMFINLNFKVSMSKRSLQSLKITKKCQIYYLAKHGAIWSLLKVTKIRDQGMENDIFVLRFKICIRGVGFDFLKGFFTFFAFFKNSAFLEKLKIHFLRTDFWINFNNFIFKIQYFYVKKISSKPKKLKSVKFMTALITG